MRLRDLLEVITDALCARILFDGNRAAGVEYERANELSQVLADREVIISAGAYNSLQLLMLSGIGLAAELQAYGIEPRADLPMHPACSHVGQSASVCWAIRHPSSRTSKWFGSSASHLCVPWARDSTLWCGERGRARSL